MPQQMPVQQAVVSEASLYDDDVEDLIEGETTAVVGYSEQVILWVGGVVHGRVATTFTILQKITDAIEDISPI